MQFLIILMR